MAEEPPEELLFAAKKKKKKKVKLDATTGEVKSTASSVPEQAPPTTTTTAALHAPPTVIGGPGDVKDGPSGAASVDATEDELILPAKKKKSRSAVPVSEADLQPSGEEAPKAAILVAAASWSEFDFPKRKKKLRDNVTFEGFDIIVALVIDEESKDDMDGSEEVEPVDSSPWAGSDRDYTYEELLERVFKIMRQKNPKMVGGQKNKLVMKPPQVVRVGAKKTSFVNFTEICKQVHRQPKHLLAFLLAELGTSGSVDGNHQLIIKGRFQQKQIETVLRRYIKEYVTCHTCRSPDTMLQKETRLFFLQCETCGSKCSVQGIKSGFQAVTTTQRREQRARQK